MHVKEFNEKLNERIDTINNVLINKRKEYSDDDDVLFNFHYASVIKGLSREEVLDGMLLKHIVSYYKMLYDLNNGVLPTKELVKEKFGDIINYFIIQEIQFLNTIDNTTKRED